MGEQLERLVSEVLKSAKYADIDPGLVARIGASELDKGRRFKEAVKAAKNKLHQVGGAYLSAAPQYPAWLGELSAAHDDDSLKAACREIMSFHASTSERLPLLGDFYAQIFDSLPPVESVLDVACGLNPLALPWMPLAEGTRYHACDMYADMVGFLNAFFSHDLVRVRGVAVMCDVVGAPPAGAYDLALILKAIPCLEQIDKQAGVRLLDGVNARFLAVSFPARSLGGRHKGMLETYQAHFEDLTAGRGWLELARLQFETELVFVMDCGGV